MRVEEWESGGDQEPLHDSVTIWQFNDGDDELDLTSSHQLIYSRQ